jgi:hypothetical protein
MNLRRISRYTPVKGGAYYKEVSGLKAIKKMLKWELLLRIYG